MDGEPSAPPQDGDGIDYSVYFMAEQNFDSYKYACLWCKQVATELRFELIVSSKKFRRDRRAVVYLRCDRGGKHRYMGKGRRNTKTKVCGCPFMIRVVELEDNMFQVFPSTEHGFHNHKLLGLGEGRSALTPVMKQKIREMAAMKVKPAEMLVSLKEMFVGSTPNIRQVYNELSKMKREGACGM